MGIDVEGKQYRAVVPRTHCRGREARTVVRGVGHVWDCDVRRWRRRRQRYGRQGWVAIVVAGDGGASGVRHGLRRGRRRTWRPNRNTDRAKRAGPRYMVRLPRMSGPALPGPGWLTWRTVTP